MKVLPLVLHPADLLPFPHEVRCLRHPLLYGHILSEGLGQRIPVLKMSFGWELELMVAGLRAISELSRP